MTHTARRLIEGTQVDTTATSYYASPSNTKTLIQNLTFSNTSASAVTVTVYLAPSGAGTPAADATTLRKTKTVASGDTWVCSEAINHVLEAGDAIYALAGAATSITIMASGVLIT